jgi:TRAP-type mannitol/chloroaromatic compound transport system permease large subunit
VKLKLRKELYFGFTLMALIVLGTIIALPAPWNMTNGHLGLLMLSLVVVAIMLGYPTAFTLMGMGVLFSYLAYRSQAPDIAVRQTLDLMVQRAYAVMTNDVLISVPLFVFMGYLVERSALIERLFRSLHLAINKIPGSLAVATLVTCAVFATATGIVGAVVTLMGLLAFPAMLKSGYDIKLSAGVITAGGCLGILIPPSVLLILYGATASVSVVQLYAGAFFPGIMLAGLYVGYVMLRAKLNPKLAPPPPPSELLVPLPAWTTDRTLVRRNAIGTLLGGLRGSAGGTRVTGRTAGRELFITALPLIVAVALLAIVQRVATEPVPVDESGLVAIGEEGIQAESGGEDTGGVQEPGAAEGVQEPREATALGEGAEDAQEPGEATALGDAAEEPKPAAPAQAEAAPAPSPGTAQASVRDTAPAAPNGSAEPARLPTPLWWWIFAGIVIGGLGLLYSTFSIERLQVFKMLLGSFFPLATLILAVLGSIIFGWATPTEAAAMGAAGGFLLAAAYRKLTFGVVKESAFLCGKTTAMVCWLFVGSSIFSAAFALLGGQEIIERWVLSLNMSPVQFMLLAQFIIFILGWPLEWTEIIVIFMPIFLPLLGHFNIDPLFFGLLVALNLQTAFLSPPVAMAAFYLKGVSPKHVTLNQIFGGMLPFMAIQIIALALLYIFPGIGLWLPSVLYK